MAEILASRVYALGVLYLFMHKYLYHPAGQGRAKEQFGDPCLSRLVVKRVPLRLEDDK